MPTAPTPLELKALEMALSVNSVWAVELQSQIPMLRVARRVQSDAGLSVFFELPLDCPPSSVPETLKERPPCVLVHHADLVDGGDFIVWIRDGLIRGLEGTAHGRGAWPTDQRVEHFTFSLQRTGVLRKE